MHDFDFILCMDWLHSFYTCMDWHSRVVRFRFSNLVWEGYNSCNPNPLILNFKAQKMISKGLLCHLVSINDLDYDIASIDSVPLVNEFQDVFPDDFS